MPINLLLVDQIYPFSYFGANRKNQRGRIVDHHDFHEVPRVQ